MVGRPPAVGLPSCLHAATGMEEVGWWGDPHERGLYSQIKPYVEVHFENVGPLWHCRSFCLGRLLYLKSRHRLSSHNVFFAAVIMPVAGAVQP